MDYKKAKKLKRFKYDGVTPVDHKVVKFLYNENGLNLMQLNEKEPLDSDMNLIILCYLSKILEKMKKICIICPANYKEYFEHYLKPHLNKINFPFPGPEELCPSILNDAIKYKMIEIFESKEVDCIVLCPMEYTLSHPNNMTAYHSTNRYEKENIYMAMKGKSKELYEKACILFKQTCLYDEVLKSKYIYGITGKKEFFKK